MKFSIGTSALQRAIKMLGIVAKMNDSDNHDKVLIEVVEDGIKFSATDGKVILSILGTPLLIEEVGSVCLEYSKLKSFIMSYKPWDEVSGAKSFYFSGAEKTTTITVDTFAESGKVAKGKLKISNASLALAPQSLTFNQANLCLNSTIFKAALNKTIYAIDPTADGSYSSLAGMNMSFDSDNIYFVGGSGRVLSEYQVKNVSDKVEGNIIFSYEFITCLRRLLVEDLQMLFDIRGNKITVKFGDIIFSGRVFANQAYMSYKDYFDNFEHHVNLSKDFLTSSLAPFNDVLDAEDNFRLSLEVADKKFRLYNDFVNIESEQILENGLQYKTDINGRLLSQAIGAIDDDYILFKFSEKSNMLILDSSTWNNHKTLVTIIRRR